MDKKYETKAGDINLYFNDPNNPETKDGYPIYTGDVWIGDPSDPSNKKRVALWPWQGKDKRGLSGKFEDYKAQGGSASPATDDVQW